MLELIEEYEESKRMLRKALPNADEVDIPKINSMITEIDYALEYLKLGHNPAHYRGIYKSSGYIPKMSNKQKVLLRDQQVIERFYNKSLWESDDNEISNEKEQALNLTLQVLKKEHLEILIMFELLEYTYKEIAEMLDMSVGTIKSIISRSKRKLLKEGERTLFNPYMNE